jgi:hypothetical protein
MFRQILSVAFVVCGVLAGNACASQSEGQRCDTLSGREDCDPDLVCTPASQLAIGANQANAKWGLCCPPAGDRTRQPIEACFAASSSGAGGSTGAGGADAGSTGGSGGSDSGGATGGSAGSSGAASGGTTGADSGSTGGSTGSGGAAPTDAASGGGG